MPLTCLYLTVLIMFIMGNIIRVSTIQMHPLFWHVLFGRISTSFLSPPTLFGSYYNFIILKFHWMNFSET